jgi:hypothetical protein
LGFGARDDKMQIPRCARDDNREDPSRARDDKHGTPAQNSQRKLIVESGPGMGP